MSGPEPVLRALGTGLLFGLSAGLAPGPLLALVITQTLRGGARAGMTVAVAPLLTDVPIVGVCVVLVGVVAGSGTPVGLGAIGLVGAVFVSWLALDTWRAKPPEPLAVPAAGATGAADPQADTRATPSATRGSILRGALVNVANPHPWVFWIAIGAPTLLAAWAGGGPMAAAAFLAGFYALLVGSKLVLALVVGRARGRVGERGYRWTMRVLAILLAVFAAGLLREALPGLAGS